MLGVVSYCDGKASFGVIHWIIGVYYDFFLIG